MVVFGYTKNSSLSSFVQDFRALSQVVAEKSLTEKKFTDKQTNKQTNKQQTNKQTNKQTNIITEKAKTIYPLYTSYWGYNNLLVHAWLFSCLFCCFTSQVNSVDHGGTISSPNHTFSWASLNKQLTNTSCQYFRL